MQKPLNNPELEPVACRTYSLDDLATEVHSLQQAAVQAFTPTEANRVMDAVNASVQTLSHESLVSVRVARLLLAQHADSVVTAAIMLGPMLARGVISREQVNASYGAEVAKLVDEAQRISPLRTDTASHWREDCADLLRSTASDIRLLVARVATRIVDLELPGLRSAEQQRQLAIEARELLVPLADRIGLGKMRGLLEDACFRTLDPEIHCAVQQSAAAIQKADELCLTLLTEKVIALLAHHCIQAEVQSRSKSLWSLYSKMRQCDLPLERIMDRLGARVIVASVPECYTVLGVLHRHFRPIPDTFRDYIGLPKDNGYQSLHTCVYPLREISAKPVEFQIRTRAMHAEAEFGAAAHWLYKSREDGHIERIKQRRWLEEVADCHSGTLDHAAFVERLERLACERSLVVYLRGGEQVRVPDGSTASDLIGQLSVGPTAPKSVRINSQECELSAPLSDGDTLEWHEVSPSYLRRYNPGAARARRPVRPRVRMKVPRNSRGHLF